MELATQVCKNEETVAPKVIAQEIYDKIIESVRRLEGMHGPDSDHSALVELRGEKAMAFRALQRFEEIELLTQVA